MPSKRAIAKADLVDIESRLAPYFPQPLAGGGVYSAQAATYEDSDGSWAPPLR